jgi:predicted AAA+ superfamily ATPase
MDSLNDWFSSKKRKSLILRGARQVGKTWLVREFCKQKGLNLVEINFEKQELFKRIFTESIEPEQVIQNIELITKQPVGADSLIFFDEVQDCPIALTSLKHFTESSFRFPVVAAGSYLGLALKSEAVSQPVGYVDELTLYPMTFEEFLRANEAHPSLVEASLGEKPVNTIIHSELLKLYRHFLFVGGMPECVKTWIESDSALNGMNDVRRIQKTLLSRFKADFSKYFARDAFHISRTWELVAEQLTRDFSAVRRFQFRDSIPGKRDFRAFSDYFACLSACGLVHLSHVINHPVYPLKTQKKDSLFKCFYFDTGILLAEVEYDFDLLAPESDVIFKGPIAENFVACELAKRETTLFSYLKQNSTAEIEFLIQKKSQIIPIEVKNNSAKAKSLASYIDEFEPKQAVKLSQSIGGSSSSLVHLPIYQVALACGDLDSRWLLERNTIRK